MRACVLLRPLTSFLPLTSQVDSPHALTFGPQMLKSIKKHAKGTPLDVHLVVARPLRYVKALAEAGADHVTAQWESLGGDAAERAKAFGEFSLLSRKVDAKLLPRSRTTPFPWWLHRITHSHTLHMSCSQ